MRLQLPISWVVNAQMNSSKASNLVVDRPTLACYSESRINEIHKETFLMTTHTFLLFIPKGDEAPALGEVRLLTEK